MAQILAFRETMRHTSTCPNGDQCKDRHCNYSHNSKLSQRICLYYLTHGECTFSDYHHRVNAARGGCRAAGYDFCHFCLYRHNNITESQFRIEPDSHWRKSRENRLEDIVWENYANFLEYIEDQTIEKTKNNEISLTINEILPTEILTEILKWTCEDTKTFDAVTLTCSYWKTLAENHIAPLINIPMAISLHKNNFQKFIIYKNKDFINYTQLKLKTILETLNLNVIYLQDPKLNCVMRPDGLVHGPATLTYQQDYKNYIINLYFNFGDIMMISLLNKKD